MRVNLEGETPSARMGAGRSKQSGFKGILVVRVLLDCCRLKWMIVSVNRANVAETYKVMDGTLKTANGQRLTGINLSMLL